jgi:hypothetical protein
MRHTGPNAWDGAKAGELREQARSATEEARSVVPEHAEIFEWIVEAVE